MFMKLKFKSLIPFQRQANQRLGYGILDAIPIKSHTFFKLCNWDDVVSRRVEPPFKPVLVSMAFILSAVTRPYSK